MKDHISASTGIESDDLGYSPFADKVGLQKAWVLFENELETIVNEINVELVA